MTDEIEKWKQLVESWTNNLVKDMVELKKRVENIEAIEQKLESVEDYQDRMDARLSNLEAKFDRLVKFIESFVLDSEKSNFKDYLEDKTND